MARELLLNIYHGLGILRQTFGSMPENVDLRSMWECQEVF